MRNQSYSSNPAPGFFRRNFLDEKLQNWIGYSLVFLISIGFAILMSANLSLGLQAFAVIVSLFVLLICLLKPLAGLYITTLYCFFASALSRFLFSDELPVGVLVDILVFTTFAGLFFSKKYDLKKNSGLFFKKRPIVLFTTILIYLCLELFNPLGHSFEGWLQVMRKVVESFLIVFIGYNVFDSLSKVWKYINLLFVIAIVAAVYGCFQEWHGLPTLELNWVDSDPVRHGLISLWGHYRKFSVMNGPTEFGVIMAGCALFFLILGLHQKKLRNKVMYIAGACVMILGMTYSGTRTANAMLVGGVIMYLMLTINKASSKLLAVGAVLAFLFVLKAPIYSSATLNRFRSTFSATKDASYNVRETNRQSVQPFIWSHPFGGGLATTGANGTKYNPSNPNAGFPTDSSYLNKALESGWVGMALTCILYFLMLQYIFRGYFLARSKLVKVMLAASAAFFFSYFIGEIAQEAVGQFSNIVVYFPLFAIFLRVREFGEPKGGLT